MLGRRLIAKVVVTIFLAFGVGSAPAQEPGSSVRADAFSLPEATIDDIHAAFNSGQITCRRLVELYLERIEAYNQAGPNLNAVQTINPRAVQEAEQLDAAYQSSGPVGALHCIPVLVKDQVETSDMPTTYGSTVFKEFVPQRDATIVTKLKKAGAVILGKTTMGEFATSYIGSAFGVVRNAYDPARNPSGSSAGTGSGVAANFAAVGIGEDTGGSIRGPAAVASLVGLRPTVPLVSRYGMMPANPSKDTLGPITRTVKDAAILLDVIAGYDPNDPVTAYAVGQVPASYTTFLSRDGLEGARIGVIREPMDSNADPDSEDYKKVRVVMERALAGLKALGATLVDPVTIPELKDRVKRVHQDNLFETEQAINSYLGDHPTAPVKTVKEILLTGEVVPRRANQLLNNVGRSTNDLGYLQVLLVKEETRQIVLKLMADLQLDAMVYATFDHPPAMIPEDILTNPDPEGATGVGNNRRLSPVLGFPAMTVPAGFTTDGLPVGIEFLSRPFAEGTLFKLGYAYEQGTRHRKPPALTPPLQGEP
jgi:amidase